MYNTILYILTRVWGIIFILASLLFCCEIHNTLWVYYVKLFQLLGVFRFLESDFNKTINSHNYFPISIFYYKKSKQPKTIWKWLVWFIIVVIFFYYFWYYEKIK